MVFQKKLDYGSNGYPAPSMPHVPKSARGKRTVRKKVEDNQMCAFDLLATVAGNLLEGKSSAFSVDLVGSSNSSIRKNFTKLEQEECKKLSKADALDQHSSNERIPDSGLVCENQISETSKEPNLFLEASIPGSDSVSTKFKEAQYYFHEGENDKSGVGSGFLAHPDKCPRFKNSPSSEELPGSEGEGTKMPFRSERKIVSSVVVENTPGTEDPMDLDTKPPLLCSRSIAAVPFCKSNYHSDSLRKDENGMEFVVHKDDDESSSGCTHSSILSNKACRPQRIGDRWIRKLLASKYWKGHPKALQNHEFSNYDFESKPALRASRLCYTRRRTQRSCFKRRKLVERYCRSIPFADLPTLCRKGNLKYERGDLTETLQGANAASSSLGKKSAHCSSDYQVKLRIKSFNVPELLIDMPETSTVGSLKQTVMEAVTAILDGGLRVGVLFQGKKVRDENKTLLQAGISHGDQLDSLGFMLEPDPVKNLPLTCDEDTNFIGIANVAEPLARLPPLTPAVVSKGDTASSPHVLTPCHSDHDSVHLPTNSSLLDEKESNSRALVVVPPVITEALAVVPQRKLKRPEAVQRRIRRPFTVTEVEALVQAVEKIGTGRWRDVKLGAFDNAKHRTYVDLKDKWKTLVHTAKISPQQRRGEPVPQELLDRVLSAHSYWSQQQARLQLKPPP